MTVSALQFQVGARVLGSVSRRVAGLSVGLDEVLAGELPVLRELAGADGWLVTGLREDRAGALRYLHPETVATIRQRYTRYYVDLTLTDEAYRARLSSATRSSIDRKRRKLAVAGGAIDLRGYRAAAEIAEFLPLARALSAMTYQQRRLDAGLPTDATFDREAVTLAGADAMRGWLLFLDEAPIAYLCGIGSGTSLRYAFVGHDPDQAALSPGIVLLAEALSDLRGDRFLRFDFTEGEGQHKRQFSTDGVACVDMLLLRRSAANRAALTALGAFDGAVRLAKRVMGDGGLKRMAARRLR